MNLLQLNKNGKKSTAKKLVVSMGITIFISTIAIVLLATYLVYKSTSDATSDYGLEVAKSVSKSIDSKEYQKLLDNREDEDEYNTVYTRLNQALKDTGAKYLYTVEVDGNGKDVNLLVDATDISSPLHKDMGAKTNTLTIDMVKQMEDKGFYKSAIINDGGDYGSYITLLVPIKSSTGQQIGILGFDLPADYIITLQHKYVLQAILYSIIALLIIFVVGSFLAYRRVTHELKPLEVMTKASEAIENGDVTGAKQILDSYETTSDSDIGILYHTEQRMVSNIESVLAEINLSNEDLTKLTPVMQGVTSNVEHSSLVIEESMTGIVEGSRIQLETMQETSQATNEMAIAIQRIAENITLISEVSQESLGNTEEGIKTLKETVEAVQEFKSTTEQITTSTNNMISKHKDIEQVLVDIKTIADQTNLLSLNASIEAARAGEHGKGFAVVAEEVRKLADESKGATIKVNKLLESISSASEEVMASINDSFNSVDKGVKAVESTQHAFDVIYEKTTALDASIQEVSAATEEVSASAEEISASVDEVANISKETTDSTTKVVQELESQKQVSKEAGNTLNEIIHISRNLDKSVQKFK